MSGQQSNPTGAPLREDNRAHEASWRHETDFIPHPRMLKWPDIALSFLLGMGAIKGDDVDMEGISRAIRMMAFDHHAPASPNFANLADLEKYLQFQKSVRRIEGQLIKFAHAILPLGSSAALQSNTGQLRTHFRQVLHLFDENGTFLYPDKIKSDEPFTIESLRQHLGSLGNIDKRGPIPNSNPERLPHELALLADGLEYFFGCLCEVPEYPESIGDRLKECTERLVKDLRYWASCLVDFEGRFRSHALRRLVNELAGELVISLDDFHAALLSFTSDGVTSIKTAQRQVQTGFLNLSTVATFFSGVTATTLQYTVTSGGRPHKAVDTLWVSSLILSVSAAINSQLAYHWRGTAYRSPQRHVPGWVTFGLTSTPLILLSVSVLTFFIGLVIYTYSLPDGRILSITASILTASTCLALLAMGVWLSAERIVYWKTSGKQWLGDLKLPIKELAVNVFSAQRWWPRPDQNLPRHQRTDSIGASSNAPVPDSQQPKDTDGTVAGPDIPLDLKRSTSPDSATISDRTPRQRSPTAAIRSSTMLTGASGRGSGRRSPTIFRRETARPGPAQRQETFIISRNYQPTSPIERFRRIGWLVILHLRQNRKRHWARQGVHSTALFETGEDNVPVSPDFANFYKSFDLIGTTPAAHRGLIKDMQFSPDGKWLATCGLDSTVILWEVNEGVITLDKMLPSAVGGPGFGNRVLWCSNSEFITTRTTRKWMVWRRDTGRELWTMPFGGRNPPVARWSSKSEELAIVDDRRIQLCSPRRRASESYTAVDLRISVRAVVLTPDDKKLFLAGSLRHSKQGLAPSKSRPEQLILLFDRDKERILAEAPVLDEVSDLSITEDGGFVLVSYTAASKAPPELWRMRELKRADSVEVRLDLYKVYGLQETVTFVGSAMFAPGDVQEQFVVAASEGGDVHVWDRQSGVHLHAVKATDMADGVTEKLTGIAWNGGDPRQLMFASATYHGLLNVWSAPRPEAPRRAESPVPLDADIVVDITSPTSSTFQR